MPIPPARNQSPSRDPSPISMEKIGGLITGKRAKPTDGGEDDRLSALPDDLLVQILARLDTTAEAVRTSVLASRWRKLWRSLSVVRLDPAPDGHRIRVLLDAPDEVPDLHRLSVTTEGAGPDSVTAWLPAAARRLIGALVYHNNMAPKKADDDGEEAAAAEEEEEAAVGIQLPCFEKATEIELDLGFLGLALPSVGVFNRLTDLSLSCVQFRGPGELGNAVSSSRCPLLQKLSVCYTRGLDTLTIDSGSLLQLTLRFALGLLKLTIGAPVLQEFAMTGKPGNNELLADISAPRLVSLTWAGAYDSQYVNLGKLDQLQTLCSLFIVFGKQHNREQNQRWLSLLQRFRVLRNLHIMLAFQEDLDGLQYLMGDITVLPQTMVLELDVVNSGHSFGASLFHLLKMCTGLRLLLLGSHTDWDLESTCPSGCICDQPTSWKTEELALNHLEYIAIDSLYGAEHEVTFVKHLFKWAVVLKKIKIRFDKRVSESEATEFLQALAGSSRPETCVELCVFHDASKSWTCLYQKA